MPDRVPFYSLEPQHTQIKAAILKSIEDVFNSNHFVLGDSLNEFETAFAEFTGTSHCAGVANGLDAITLSLRALGIKSGDEVIVPSNTCIATWIAVTSAGATVVPVEPNPSTFNIDTRRIEEVIASRTRAIIPVHLYGQSCDMGELMRIAHAHRLFVVEDNAQGHGAQFNGRMTGSFGHCNATSFYPTKNLGSLGDAGAVTTNDQSVFEKIVALRNYGSHSKSVHDVIGANSRMDEMQAAVLSVKLRHLKQWNAARSTIAREYLNRLTGMGDLVLPITASHCTHVYHQFVVRTSRRDALSTYLLQKGIRTMIHYPIPPHLQGAYSSMGWGKGSLPVAEEISRTCLSLPVWPGMTEVQVDLVIGSIKTFWEGQ